MLLDYLIISQFGTAGSYLVLVFYI